MDLVRDIATIYKNYGFKTKIIVAAIRNPLHVLESAITGAHVATMAPAVLEQIIKHPLTDKGTILDKKTIGPFQNPEIRLIKD